MEAEIEMKRYIALHVKCPTVLTNHQQTAEFVAHACNARSMKFQENPLKRSRGTDEMVSCFTSKVPFIIDQS